MAEDAAQSRTSPAWQPVATITVTYHGYAFGLHFTVYIGHLHVHTSLAQKSPAGTARQVLLRFDILIFALHFV